MDREQRTADIIKKLYVYKNTHDSSTFVKQVCDFFDYIKNDIISESDLTFLYFLANESGVPQYYDLLCQKYLDQEEIKKKMNLLSFSAAMHEASLTYGDVTLHRYQKQVLDEFSNNKINRFVLTAPTSFGKTYLVYEVARKMKYNNILLIFPSVSLLSENYIKIKEHQLFQEYNIHSLSESDFDFNEKNIFIFTPERYLSFMDKCQNNNFDFAFVDEIYKIDNGFIIDDNKNDENERDTAYRLALEFICIKSKDILLAGPYMSIPEVDKASNVSFINFSQENGFSFFKFNEYEIVGKDFVNIKNKKQYFIGDKPVNIGKTKKEKIINIVNAISTSSENTIIYCSRRSDTERYAKILCKNKDIVKSFANKCKKANNDEYDLFIKHLESVFGNDWVVVKALKSRIGIHHGLIPKYIQKEIISLFNKGMLVCLCSTTTITEGVNTTAKNMIVTSNKKGNKPLKQFDAKNIAGRAGRFGQHYKGMVIDLNNNFENIANGEHENIKHKNYDEKSIKMDVDYQITKEKYLSEEDIVEKDNINRQIEELNIPKDIFNSFRVVGPKDKLVLYNKIFSMTKNDLLRIQKVATTLASNNAKKLDWEGFEFILETLLPIVKDDTLKRLIETKTGEQQVFSVITVLVNAYLKGGFLSMIEYYSRERQISKDEAVRTVSKYVYTLFKYSLVKYLGIFDVFYRYRISQLTKKNMDDILGVGTLIQRLEYNALTSSARILSDYGVPFKLVTYYDNENKGEKKFDEYEMLIDQRIQSLLV